MGLHLLSTLTARDMGWVGLTETVETLQASMATLNMLERYRGHFFNWYGTLDLRPLEPRYISTVDSGNLAGYLMTCKRTCQEFMVSEILPLAFQEGMRDLISLVREGAAALGESQRAEAFSNRHLLESLSSLKISFTHVSADIGDWALHLREWEAQAETVLDVAGTLALEQGGEDFQELLSRASLLRELLASVATDVRAFFPWSETESFVAALRALLPSETFQSLLHGRAPLDVTAPHYRAAAAELRSLRPEAILANFPALKDPDEWRDARAAEFEKAAQAADAVLERLGLLAADAERLCMEMNFSFLLDPKRNLFTIGFRVKEEAADGSYYDLLASEARLASFMAIAKGDVPPAHWFRLGRTLTPAGKGSALLSWSGSMFEYMLPDLIMHSPPGSLLDHTYKNITQRQIEYGKDLGTPWGVSEAAYNIRDLELTYQYSTFGVPGLGLKRGLSENAVIAPYATALASMIVPKAAARNFSRLEGEGAAGAYGFHESIDYTPERVPEGKKSVVIRSYFAHHQGMTLVALGETLLGNRMQARFHAEPMIQAAEILLQERAPKGLAVSRPHSEEVASPLRVEGPVPPLLYRFNTPHETMPRTHILSNGQYMVMLTTAGSGFSRWRDLEVTRWREDVTLDAWGQFIYLRDIETGSVWSAAYQPVCSEPEKYEAAFAEDKAEISRRDDGLVTTLEVVVSAGDDAEVRRVAVENLGSKTREIEITSYAEVVLASQGSDAAHPAFSKLFISTEFVAARGTLLATRRPRSPKDINAWAAHVVSMEGEAIGGIQYETDRTRFIGRGHTVRDPVSVIDGKPLSNTAGSVLDPVFSLRRRVRIPPGHTVRIAFATLVAPSREEALGLADKYRDPNAFERAVTLAWTHAQILLHHLNIGPDEARLFQRLANRIFFSDPVLRPSRDLLKLNEKGQQALWAYGISGDLPIMLVRYDENWDRGIAREVLRAHEYWEMKQLTVDLVFIIESPDSYLQNQQATLENLVRLRQGATPHSQQPGRIFILKRDQLPQEDRLLLQAAARAVLVSRRGSLADQVMRVPNRELLPPPAARSIHHLPSKNAPPSRPNLEFFNGLGGFAEDGAEYQILLGENQWTPAPWINVIANASFGFQVSESGAGFTWSRNSRAEQTHSLVQRPRLRRSRRGDLPAGSGIGRAVGTDRASHTRGRVAVRDFPRAGIQPFRARRARDPAGTDAAGSRRRSRQAFPVDRGKPFRKNAPPVRHLLCGMGAGRVARRGHPVREHRTRRGHQGALRAQSLERRIRRSDRLRRFGGNPILLDMRPRGIPGTEWIARLAAGPGRRQGAFRKDGRRVRSLLRSSNLL